MDAENEKISKEAGISFAALKLIELLYKEGSITEDMYRGVLREHGDIVDRASFA